MGRSRPPPSKRNNSKSKSRVKSLAIARLAKKQSDWVGKLQYSSNRTKQAEVKSKQIESVNRSRVERTSEPVPSTSSASVQSESLSSVRSVSKDEKTESSDEKKMSEPVIESQSDEKKVMPVTVKHLPTAICDLNEVANLFAACSCPECGGPVELEMDASKNVGMTVFLNVVCTNCQRVVASNHTSAFLPSGACEITRRTVTASLLNGFGQRKLNNLCEYLNLPGLNSKTFSDHAKAFFQSTPNIKKQFSKLAVQKVREAHKPMNPRMTEDTVIDIAVSFDGTWQTRGHSSKVGVTCVIDLLTGICVDFHVMSKYCQKCETTGENIF